MKAIVFDLDDTLYEQIQPFRKAYEIVFQNRFEIDIHDLFAARSRRSNEVFEQAMAGQIPMEEMYIYRVQKAFEDLGYDVTAEESLAFQRAYEEHQGNISMSDTMREILELCRKSGVKLGVVTNGPAEHQRKKAQALGIEHWIPTEHIVISEKCGASKPNAAIFRYAEEKLGVTAQECIYVGDSYTNDVTGAKRAGWRVIWLDKMRQSMNGAAYQPDEVVYSEAELLECIRTILA